MIFDEFRINIRKLSDYCLNPFHPVGKHKARVFASCLGIGRQDAEILRKNILLKMKDAELVLSDSDEFGIRFTADLVIKIYGRTAMVKTIWINRSGSSVLELVTCYIIT